MLFETFTGKNGDFYFNLRTEEKVILKSEGYTTTSARDNGIESVKKNAPDATRYTADENNFTLKASNGQIIGTSTIFSSVEEVEAAMQMVMKGASSASVKARI